MIKAFLWIQGPDLHRLSSHQHPHALDKRLVSSFAKQPIPKRLASGWSQSYLFVSISSSCSRRTSADPERRWLLSLRLLLDQLHMLKAVHWLIRKHVLHSEQLFATQSRNEKKCNEQVTPDPHVLIQCRKLCSNITAISISRNNILLKICSIPCLQAICVSPISRPGVHTIM